MVYISVMSSGMEWLFVPCFRKVKEFCQKASIDELRAKGAVHKVSVNG